jgi:hypothetical protein
MARNNQSNRGGANRGNSNRGRNNNPEGRNQYSGGVMDMARERPVAAAAAAAAAVGAGVFLWSRRSQISDQLGQLSDQIGEWRDSMSSGDDFTDESASQGFMAQPSRRGRNKSQAEISEEALTLKETGAATGSRNRSATTA